MLKVALFLICLSTSFANQKPNIVLVITDDQGYGDIGALGNTVLKTPNLDALHGESIRLTDFHVDPTCSPTRAALMTGHYSRRAGVWHTVAGRSLMRHDQVTIAQVLKDNGYKTGIFGKWHLGDNYPMRPEDKGFDEVVIHKGGGAGQGPDYWGNDYGQYTIDGVANSSRDTYFRNGVPEQFDGYCTDIWFEEAMKFIDDAKENPFFVYLSTNAPHAPDFVDDKYSSPYKEKKYNGKTVPHKIYGMIANIDENMGKLMSHLENNNLKNNTILIFMTDNGGRSVATNPNGGMKGGKNSPYDGGHRVPFFMRWPSGGLQHGQDMNELTAHFDIFPTFLSLLNIPKPDSLSFDGIDISPWLKGTSTPWPTRTLVVESQRVQTPEKHRKTSVMRNKWRLVQNGSLYDVSSDASQNNPITNNSIKSSLQNSYNTWWNDVSSRDNEYVEIVVGHPAENPSTIMSHDFHGSQEGTAIHSQSKIASGTKGNGWYALNVDRAGTYRIELRRWPEERPGPLQYGSEAKLKIDQQEWTKAYSATQDNVVVFEMPLQPGSIRLETWLGTERTAYYIKVLRLTGCTDEKYEEYDSTATVQDQSLCKTKKEIENSITPKSNKLFHISGHTLQVISKDIQTIIVQDLTGKVVEILRPTIQRKIKLRKNLSGLHLLQFTLHSGDIIHKSVILQDN